MERAEVEIDIDRRAFDELRPLAGDRIVSKHRYEIDLGQHVAELDEYRGGLEGLWIVEVEFPDRATADRFDPPDWFGDEVTGDARWANAALAVDGLPT
jgi:CYTH domain-containing protein